MLPKDFENFELRLQTLREESLESFEVAESIFEEKFQEHLETVFPRDILWAKKYIAGSFIIAYSDALQTSESPDTSEVFATSVERVVKILPLSQERQKSLRNHILVLWGSSETLEKYFQRSDDLSRDPFFALVEDFSIDGEISKEEFLLLSESYGKSGNFFSALEWLPEPLRRLFESHVEKVLGSSISERQESFEGEYSGDIQRLSNRGLNVGPIIRFISRSYYKTPGKLRKYEAPRRRLRRTMKMSLLRLLRIKLGNIDAERILQQFESCESFEDFFLMLYKLMEIVDENPNAKEIFTTLDLVEETEEEVLSAEQTKKKILKWEELTASISNLLWDTDGKLEWELLEKILDDDTHFHGEEVHFAHWDNEMAWIYAETTNEKDEEEEDNFIDEGDTLEWNYERLKNMFHELDEKKRKAFGAGDYNAIDEYNDELITLESKIEKIAKLLGKEE